MVTYTTIFNNAAFFDIDMYNQLCGNWQFGRILRTKEKVEVRYVNGPIKITSFV